MITREEIVQIIRNELQKQYDEGDLTYYQQERDAFVTIEGFINLSPIANAIGLAMVNDDN